MQNQPQEVDIKDVIIQDLSNQVSEKAQQLAQARAQNMYLQQELGRLQQENDSLQKEKGEEVEEEVEDAG